MITDIAILYAFCSKLREKFPSKDYKIIADACSADIKKPTFFVDVTPLDSDTYRRYSKELFNVTIEYVEERDLSQEDKLSMKTILNNLFTMGIKVEKTFVVFQKKIWSTKNVFSLCLTFDFFNRNEEVWPEDYYTKLMQKLDIQI
ncbi:DUF6838 family protein [uncultured Clostridium sp.]|uniref:phage tail terminator family protein n=1 Tax=uncultured Clostridium sp. TaxID=59620 RepID=UPI0025F82E80|nr:hypothetical protein [uncultured Clostridium sp.]